MLGSWEGHKLKEYFGGESLLSEAGIYTPEFMGGGMYIDSTFGMAEKFVSTPGVNLSRGTYQVVIEYEAEESGQTYSASSVNPGYWVVMGKQDVSINPKENIESFTIWAEREIKGYRIEVNYNGSGYLLIKNVQIVQTNANFGMHILIGAFLLLVINIGYVAGTRKWLKKVSQKHKNI